MDREERNEKIRWFFDTNSQTYDAIHKELMANKAAIVDLLPQHTVTILDLGVGTGLELGPLFESFPALKVTAIDLSSMMLGELRKSDVYQRYHHQITIVHGDFFEVNFPKCDAVISSAALHHFTEEDKLFLFAKVYDALQNGGTFINSDRYVETQKDQDQRFLNYELNSNQRPHMDTPLTVQNELKILRKAGFREIGWHKLDDLKYKVVYAKK